MSKTFYAKSPARWSPALPPVRKLDGRLDKVVLRTVCRRVFQNSSRSLVFFLSYRKRQVYKSGVKSWAAPLFSSNIFYDGGSIEDYQKFCGRHCICADVEWSGTVMCGMPEFWN